ncbi:hypothetical protein A2U01_0088618, partial [Trifolium medium]|nr:hypothetical protein [Trifolium medium]
PALFFVATDTNSHHRRLLASCIESLPDKGGQVAGPIEHSNGDTSTSVWIKKTSA